VKQVVSLLNKETRQNSHRETNKNTPTTSIQENPQKIESPVEAKQLDHLDVEKTMNNSNILQLLESFQKIRAEEQRLVELKQQELIKQQNLQDTLIKEMEKMKASIANLTSEIPDLQKKTQKLGEALGIDASNEDPLPKMNSPTPITKEDENLPGCVGLANCSKPEKCNSYDSCIKNYVAAEIRNEIPRL
jgi:hypothetical protein